MNTQVTFELAKLLKEKGYIEVHEKVYRSDGLLYTPNMSGSILKHSNILDGCSVTAPLIAEVVMWLYDKHKIWIVASYELNIENHKKEWFWIAIKDGEEIAYQYKDFSSPAEAYEAGIKHALKNLL